MIYKYNDDILLDIPQNLTHFVCNSQVRLLSVQLYLYHKISYNVKSALEKTSTSLARSERRREPLAPHARRLTQHGAVRTLFRASQNMICYSTNLSGGSCKPLARPLKN